MADNHDLLKSPLCEGHGEVRVREVLQLLRDQTLESKIEAGLSGNAEASEEPAELAAVAATAAEPRDSKKTSTAGIRSCPCGAGVQKSDASGHRPSFGSGNEWPSHTLLKGVELLTAALMD